MTKRETISAVLTSKSDYNRVSVLRKLLCKIGWHVANKSEFHAEDFPAATRDFDPCKHCGVFMWKH